MEVLGALQPTPTIATGYAIYPFVGLIEPGQQWTLSPREVAEVLEFPLDTLRRGTGAAGWCGAGSRSAPTPTWLTTS